MTHDGMFAWFRNESRSNPERQIDCREIHMVEQTDGIMSIHKGKLKLVFKHEDEITLNSWVEVTTQLILLLTYRCQIISPQYGVGRVFLDIPPMEVSTEWSP